MKYLKLYYIFAVTITFTIIIVQLDFLNEKYKIIRFKTKYQINEEK